MDIVGKIIQVLPEQSGMSKTGNPWKVQSYVLETQEQYPRKVCFEIFGEDRIKNNPCKVDDVVTVSFDIESREFNGRWYTSIRAWRVQQGAVAAAPATAQPTVQPSAQPAAQPAAQPMAQAAVPAANVQAFDAAGDESSDLPF
ncbi:MAG: DUF3127 domain-containing protein [Paludibacteraceae bacterium]|nr:DUF3127 domain-containing protein [Bacteroidales bacterium]MDY4148588.1 DUF3127 domain-containing protein [Paludibacteraceae bacterium]